MNYINIFTCQKIQDFINKIINNEISSNQKSKDILIKFVRTKILKSNFLVLEDKKRVSTSDGMEHELRHQPDVAFTNVRIHMCPTRSEFLSASGKNEFLSRNLSAFHSASLNYKLRLRTASSKVPE